MAINDKLKIFENNIGYTFKNGKLLRTALTHKSYAYEMKNISKDSYNERVEYLGDAILEHVISDLLYNIEPIMSEGDMTKKRAQIVCEKSLSEAFRNIDGNQYMFLGKCEIATGGRYKDAILADAFESVIGAIYLDSSFDTAKKIAIKLLEEQINDSLSGNINITDYKTLLQEKLQENGEVDISYNIFKEEGPDHNKTFHVDLFLDNNKIGSGVGKTRKQAEQKAAEVAYAKYT